MSKLTRMLALQIAKSKVVFVSFTTLCKPADADVFVKARGRPLDKLRADIVAHYPPPGSAPAGPHSSELLLSPSPPFLRVDISPPPGGTIRLPAQPTPSTFKLLLTCPF